MYLDEEYHTQRRCRLVTILAGGILNSLYPQWQWKDGKRAFTPGGTLPVQGWHFWTQNVLKIHETVHDAWLQEFWQLEAWNVVIEMSKNCDQG